MAIYGNDGKLYPITKVGTGFQDVFLEELSSTIIANKIDNSDQSILLNGLKPDILVKPTMVWEIGFDSFTLSPIYQVGKSEINKNRGISLRFPKFKRIRDDKLITQANTWDEIIELYNKSITYLA